ncbi:MAG: hypothetical protein ACREBV_08800 [Candidatus Zixiibacteriota bacterium]
MKRQLPFFLVFLFGTIMVIQYFVPHEYSERVKEFLLDWIIVIGIFALALGIWSLISVSMDKINKRRPNYEYAFVTLIGLVSMTFFGFTNHLAGSWWTYFLALIILLASLWLIVQGIRDTGAAGKNVRTKLLGGVGLTILFCLITIFDNSWEFRFYTPEGLDNPLFKSFFSYLMVPLQSTMFALLAFFISSAAYRAFRARNLLATLLLIAALIVMLRFTPGPWGDFLSRTSTWVMNVPNLAAQRAIVVGIGLGMVATALKVILGIERGYMGKG